MTGVILAGGRSSRLGQDKAFLNIEGRPIIEILVSKFSGVFEEVIIVTSDKEKFEYLDVNIVEDIFPDKGPLGGIHTALVHSGSLYSFITACDMPFLDMDVVRNMISNIDDCDVYIRQTPSLRAEGEAISGEITSSFASLSPRNDSFWPYKTGFAEYIHCDILVPRVKEKLHPLCAIYSKRCIPVIEKNLKEGRLRVRDVFSELKTRIIDIEKNPESFININTKEDYEQISG